MTRLLARVHGRYRTLVAKRCSRLPARLRADGGAVISFTFDDFPKSALHVGGAELLEAGARGTYYASLGLAGTMAPTGRIFDMDELEGLVRDGHELGCHTYDHLDAWSTSATEFERSIVRNRDALSRSGLGASFGSFAYPISGPNRGTKRVAGAHHRLSRGGGQTFNDGAVDLALLQALFLEKCRDAPEFVERVIDRTVAAGGWLVLATHDVEDGHTPYGCTPAFFRRIVRHAQRSGARILPVAAAAREKIAAPAAPV